MNSTMSMMSASSMQRQPPPPDRDVFKVADSDSDGQVSATELKTLAAGIEKITGNSLNVEEALTTFDEDQSGSLSGEELYGLLSSQGFNPAEIIGGENGESGMAPPPPPPQQVSSAYAANAGGDTLGELIEYLQSQTGSGKDYTAFELTA
ncbi:EF-hand domain-containing protein [Desulfuromonas versatilis]|nr:EF-hand domain-containing protein [Desulfuromonas versatilis]